jgi:hypothetical protein
MASTPGGGNPGGGGGNPLGPGGGGLPGGGGGNPLGPSGGGPGSLVLTKEKIDEIKKQLDGMLGKPIDPTKPIDISGGAAWYVAYKTS